MLRPAESLQSEAWDEPAQSELACSAQEPHALPEPQWTAPISAEDARDALSDANQLAAGGKLDDALLALRVVEHALPRIGDRIALRRAELLMRAGRPAEACDAYKLAEQSPERNVAAQARIELVRCLLEAGKHDGETELDKVTRRYPHLIGRAELRLTLARAREQWGNLAGAVAIYRSIDLDEPQAPAADEARSALTRIAATGFAVRAFNGSELLDRAQRLIEQGSVEAAHAAVDELSSQSTLSALQRGRVRLLAAKLARTEGRWQDVRDLVAQALALGVPATEATRLLPRGGAAVGSRDEAQLAEAQARIRKLLAGRSLREAKNAQLMSVFEIAVQQKLAERATEALTVMRQRASLSPSLRYNAALLAFGLASDVSVADLLDTVTQVPSYAVSGRYHRARALERLGRFGEAEAEYLRVIHDDKRAPNYYAMWADLRLWSMQSATTQSCAPANALHDDVAAVIDALQRPLPSVAEPPAAAARTDDAATLAQTAAGAAQALAAGDPAEPPSADAAPPVTAAALAQPLQPTAAEVPLVPTAVDAPLVPATAANAALVASAAAALAPVAPLAPTTTADAALVASTAAALAPVAPTTTTNAALTATTELAALAPTLDAKPALTPLPTAAATSTAQPAALAERDVDAARNAALRERLLARLGPLSASFGAAYPWLARAADLVELDLFEDAADEIGEAYLAWRDARGELRLRSGLEAVLTGNAPPRHAADGELRRLRLSLDKPNRNALAEVAELLGDPGVALRFAGGEGDLRPRAYSDQVEKAATKYGLDPNLLFAVMRVESIYHRQIVSFAGAVGLMQIMPRTGMLIARKLGVERFEVSDLLDPKINVEFAAWYLSSLIKRFDGRVPLAIAAYNGGPHNVRLWMRENNPDMPLEAFLERIPFSQTHEYVRRVLTHYAAYRAQQNLPMARLDASLPKATPDTLAF